MSEIEGKKFNELAYSDQVKILMKAGLEEADAFDYAKAYSFYGEEICNILNDPNKDRSATIFLKVICSNSSQAKSTPEVVSQSKASKSEEPVNNQQVTTPVLEQKSNDNEKKSKNSPTLSWFNHFINWKERIIQPSHEPSHN